MVSLNRMDAYFLHVSSRLDKLRQGEQAASGGLLDELKSWPLWRAVLAEFLATMVFVFIGTMSATTMADTTDLDAKFIRVRFYLSEYFYFEQFNF